MYLFWILLIAAAIIVAVVVPGWVATNKGYGETVGQRFGWLLFAVFLTPIAWVVAFVLPNKTHSKSTI